MRYSEVELIRSEIGTVEQLLRETPEDEPITRMTWQNRLRTLDARLREAEARKAMETAIRMKSFGTLLGVLPESRRFEARLDDERVIAGRIARSVRDVGALLNPWIGAEAYLHLQVTRSSGRTRYLLVNVSSPRHPDGTDGSPGVLT